MSMAGMPLLAAEKKDYEEALMKQFRDNNDVLLRAGVDVLGSNDDITGSTATGDKKGLERSMVFEVAVGAEEKIENFEFGFRRTMTIYSYGDETYYNGAYKADISNYGVETTAARYFKATQYFKPYLGLGLGLNINSYDDHGAYKKSDNYQLTVHAVGGISGELFVGIGYYVEYKYRFAPSETLQVTPKNDNTNILEIENRGVNGGVAMAGLSYQF